MQYLKQATLAILVGTFSCGFAKAALHAMPAANPQQNKMSECNKEAAGKKGDDRNQFMSSCLSK